MSLKTPNINVRVLRIEQASPLIKRFTLEAADGGPLPAFSGGSHIMVQIPAASGLIHNAYSLLSSPYKLQQYQIAVRREEVSRGGSAFMHDFLAEGDILQISPPNNLFPLHATPERQILIAGGIGITPFMSQMEVLQASGAAFELHYAFRSQEQAAFVDELTARYGAHCHFHDASRGEQCNVSALLAHLGEHDHVYVCGPQSLIEAVQQAGAEQGIPPARLHWEQFAASTSGGAAFTVVLARSGREIPVAAEQTILQAIESDGSVAVDCLCREGVCGTCEVGIVEGEAEHRDQYLSEEEKQAQNSMLICVSRAKGSRIVLDL
ncbi:PDR/VanB family oxidoreductase [Aquitalea sp. LB_tupeE]|uniref:PDR/VanB family oxidoreductase n=1 Tax=Aquitalea sp. LB_tupeE TaxID=2748078 RepID=UPI0015B9D457|nr:PDR/VanB family oxidoreductase [Aquitalea sp. LB_tupeE]NWK78598.1 oxidoreductase [Aquitalea sp. LB_tupeE]